jgi:hypothetical protein
VHRIRWRLLAVASFVRVLLRLNAAAAPASRRGVRRCAARMASPHPESAEYVKVCAAFDKKTSKRRSRKADTLERRAAQFN